jgi:hypothetical protein
MRRRKRKRIFETTMMDGSKKSPAIVVATIMAVLWLISLHPGFAQNADNDSLEIVAEGKFEAPAGSSKELAGQIALFEAKKKAVESAGRYLARHHFILNYELRKEEIYSLAAGKIQASILAQQLEHAGNTFIYTIRIRARVRSADYVEADSQDKRLEMEEAGESLKEELEPNISKAKDPGRDIAKAYILLRTEKLRPAIIYLDRLEEKYPGWTAIYMAKAMGYYLLLEPHNMKNQLEKACAAGDEKACDDLKNIKRIRQFDLEAEKLD